MALLVFVGATLSVTWPVLKSPGTLTFPDTTGDNYFGFWTLWWTKEALVQGKDLFWTDLLYFPSGTSLVFTELGPLNGLVAAPWLILFDSPRTPAVAHNLLVVLSFVLTGYCTYRFALWKSGSQWGGILAGLAVAFSAFRFHHLEHLNLLSFYWIPLTAWVLGRWVFAEPNAGKNTNWKPLLAIFLCGLGAVATSYTVLTQLGCFLLFWLPGEVWLRRNGRLKRIGARATAAVGALLLGISSLAWRWLAESTGSLPQQAKSDIMPWMPDMIGFLQPERSLVLGPWVDAMNLRLHPPGGDELFLGFGLVALALVGFVRNRTRCTPLMLTALIGLALALGPGLWIAGTFHDLDWTLYDGLVALVPPLGVGRAPSRFLVVSLVALAPLAALGFQHLLHGRRGFAVAGAVALWMVVELFPRGIQAVPVEISPAFARMRTESSPGAVMEISPEFRAISRSMFHQVIHGRPLVANVFHRPSPGSIDLVRELNAYQRLGNPRTIPGIVRDLAHEGVAYLVVDRANMTEAVFDQAIRALSTHAELWHRDKDMAILHLDTSKAVQPE